MILLPQIYLQCLQGPTFRSLSKKAVFEARLSRQDCSTWKEYFLAHNTKINTPLKSQNYSECRTKRELMNIYEVLSVVKDHCWLSKENHSSSKKCASRHRKLDVNDVTACHNGEGLGSRLRKLMWG